MAAVSSVDAKLVQALSTLQSNGVKLDNIGGGLDNLRQQVSDLLVGAGVPDSIAAQVDAILIAAQLDAAKINAALAKLATPLPPPTSTPPPVVTAPTITLAVNVLAATAPGSVQLTPTVSADVTKVECYRDGVLIYTKLAAPFGYTDTNVPAGTYAYTEKAFGPGGTTISNAVNVTINPATVTGPVLIQPL